MLSLLEKFPNAQFAEILSYLDIDSCIALRSCSRHLRKNVEKLAKKEMNIIVMHSDDEFSIGLTSSNPQIDLMPADSLSFRIRQIKNNRSKVVEMKKLVTGSCSSVSFVESVETFSAEWNSTAAKTTFRIVGRLLADPLLVIKNVSLRLGHFYGTIDFGQPTRPFEELNVEEGMDRSTLEGLIMNLNNKFKNCYEANYRDEYRLHTDYSRFISDKMLERNLAIRMIESAENCYKSAFPEEYKIQSLEDGYARVHQLISKMMKTRIGQLEKDRAHNGSALTINLMLLRAAFTSDPVECIRTTCDDYSEKIDLLRFKIDNTPMPVHTLPMLFLAFIAMNTNKAKSKFGNNNLHLDTLKVILASERREGDYWQLMENIDRLCGRFPDDFVDVVG